MAPLATVLFVSLIIVSASIAGPIPPYGRVLPAATVDSVPASTGTLTESADVHPTPVFTLGPSAPPHISASTTSTTTSSARLEMDWLS